MLRNNAISRARIGFLSGSTAFVSRAAIQIPLLLAVHARGDGSAMPGLENY